jgi:alkylhydroperoxidase family enzyme
LSDRHEAARRQLEDAVLRSPGHLEPRLREAIAEGREVPEELRLLVEKIRDHAYQISDADFAPLRARYSEDQLFEAVVSAALGAALTRLGAGLKALANAS